MCFPLSKLILGPDLTVHPVVQHLQPWSAIQVLELAIQHLSSQNHRLLRLLPAPPSA